MIVTIDGPAGAGKSTTARALAGRLGFDFLDTGAMYRAVAFAAGRAGIAMDDGPALDALAAKLQIEYRDGRTYLDGEDISAAIRSLEVTQWVRSVAAVPAVRSRLVQLQRDWAKGKNVVSEGRDQGTVVFPDADCKIFLTADEQSRALRRQEDFERQGTAVPLEEVLTNQRFRDRVDSERAVGPLAPARDAVFVDTSHLSLEEVVQRIEALVRARASSPTKNS